MKKLLLSLAIMSAFLPGCAMHHAVAKKKQCVPTWTVVTDVTAGALAAMLGPTLDDDPDRSVVFGVGGFALIFSSGTVWAYRHCKGDL